MQRIKMSECAKLHFASAKMENVKSRLDIRFNAFLCTIVHTNKWVYRVCVLCMICIVYSYGFELLISTEHYKYINAKMFSLFGFFDKELSQMHVSYPR